MCSSTRLNSLYFTLVQWRTNPRRQVAVATKFCTVCAQYLFVLSVEITSCPTLEAPRILRWLLEFWEIVAPLHYVIGSFNCMHPLVRGFRCRRTSSVFVRLSSKTIFWKQSVVWYSVYLCNKMKHFF